MSSSEAPWKSRPIFGNATLTMKRSRLARQMPTQTIASTIGGECVARALSKRRFRRGDSLRPDGYDRCAQSCSWVVSFNWHINSPARIDARITVFENCGLVIGTANARLRPPATDRGQWSSETARSSAAAPPVRSTFEPACAALQSGKAAAKRARPALVSLMRRLLRSAFVLLQRNQAVALQRPKILADRGRVHDQRFRQLPDCRRRIGTPV